MDLDTNLNHVLQVLRNPGLHFPSQETPYSLDISIRKRFKPNRTDLTQFVLILSSNHDDNICDLTKQCKLFEDVVERAKS